MITWLAKQTRQKRRVGQNLLFFSNDLTNTSLKTMPLDRVLSFVHIFGQTVLFLVFVVGSIVLFPWSFVLRLQPPIILLQYLGTMHCTEAENAEQIPGPDLDLFMHLAIRHCTLLWKLCKAFFDVKHSEKELNRGQWKF